MECYIIKHNKSDEKNPSYGANNAISVAEIEKLEKNCEALIKKLKFEGKSDIKFYGSTNVRARNILSVFSTRFLNEKIVAENGITTDPVFNDRNFGELSKKTPDEKLSAKERFALIKADLNLNNSAGIEKKVDFENRVFDALASIVMENGDRKNQVVILIVGDDFIKACQKNKDIASMVYFGDEAYYVPKTTTMFYKDYLQLSTNEHERTYVDFISKPSKKEFVSLKPERVVLEKPQITPYNEVRSVSDKYITKLIQDKLAKQNAIKNEKVW